MYPVLELLAVVAGATYGMLLARQHHMDFVGVFTLAFVVAFGGGTLRDLFLDRHPLFWIQQDHYSIIVFVLALVTSALPRLPTSMERWLNIPDAIGLGLFSVVGALAAIDSGTSMFIAVLLGVVTGTFGGVMGDIFCNRVPSLFGTSPLFATCSFVGCWLLFFLKAWNVPADYATYSAVLFIVCFRLAAVKWGWTLPSVGAAESDRSEP
ncbi:MAG: trimeric intracellular cation channel family protein [Fuerstiella sp.]